MSRESLLDDAILKAKEAEDWQLVEWLRMARGGESAARWYAAKLGEARLGISNLMTENAKLRDLALNCYRMAKVHCTDRDCYARCSHWPECYERDTIEHVEPCELSVIAQELGIEVDE